MKGTAFMSEELGIVVLVLSQADFMGCSHQVSGLFQQLIEALATRIDCRPTFGDLFNITRR